jgi:hypothetical protein
MKHFNKKGLLAAGLALTMGTFAMGCYYDRDDYRDYGRYRYEDSDRYRYGRYDRDDWRYRRDRDRDWDRGRDWGRGRDWRRDSQMDRDHDID